MSEISAINPRRARQLLALVSVGAFLATVDAPIVSVAMPSLAASFPTASLTELAWVLDAYFVAFGAMLLTSGRLADRFSRPRFLLGGLSVFAVASMACAVAPSAEWLVAARVVQAIGGAAILPAGQALLLAANPPERRYLAITALGTIVALGSALAPTIGGLLVEYLSWQWIFWISAGVAALALLCGVGILPSEPGDRSVRMPDPIGTTTQAFALVFLVYAILGINRWGLADWRVLTSFAVAFAGVAVSAWRSQTHPSPAIHLSLLREREFALANTASFFLGLGLFSYSFAAVLYLTEQWEYGPLEVGLSFVPGAVASAFGGRSAPHLAKRFGAATVGAFAAGLSVVGLSMLALMATATPHFLTSFVPGQLLGGLGMAAAITTAVALAIMRAPEDRFAAASGLNGALRQVGGAVGVAAVAALFASTSRTALDDVRLAWAVSAGAVFIGMLALRAHPADRTAPADAAPPAAEPKPQSEARDADGSDGRITIERRERVAV